MTRLTGNRCQCTACGEYFGSVRGFDRHRTGDYGKDRRCRPVADLLATGWIRNARGFLLQPDPRRAGAGIPAHRAHAAMVRPTPATRVPETRTST